MDEFYLSNTICCGSAAIRKCVSGYIALIHQKKVNTLSHPGYYWYYLIIIWIMVTWLQY